jgi:hypothetical protein
MSPERRGQSAKSEYAQGMAEDYATMHAQAVKGGTLEILPEVFARYRARQAGAYRAYLASSSRCVSSFIAGPSNFPAARMNKRSDIAHRRLTEYLDGGKMALQAACRTLRPDLRAIMAGDADAIDRLTAKIASAERSQDAMKAANKAIRTHAKAGQAHQVAALLELGFSEAQAVALLKPDFCGRIGFANYSLTNNNANIRRMRERLEQITKAQACEVVAVQCASGIKLEDDAPANRVRLYFPGKPSEEVRTELKASGFRWAPSVGAWQAYRNNGTLATARRMAGEAAPVVAQEVAELATICEASAAPDVDATEPTGTDTPTEPSAPSAAPATDTPAPAADYMQPLETLSAGGGEVHAPARDLVSVVAPAAQVVAPVVAREWSSDELIAAAKARGFHAVLGRKGERVVLAKKGADYGLSYSNTTQGHRAVAKLAAAGLAADLRGWSVVITGVLAAPVTDAPKARAMAPKDAERFTDPLGRWECFLCKHGARFSVISYAADAFNPTEHYGYRTEEQARAAVAKFQAFAEDLAARRQARKDERKAKIAKGHGLQVGDVLRSSWGYDQTNIDYYEVTKLVGVRMVEVRKIAAMKEYSGDMSGVCVPQPGRFIGEAMRRFVDEYGNVNVMQASFGRASKIEPAIVAGVRCYEASGWSSYA